MTQKRILPYPKRDIALYPNGRPMNLNAVLYLNRQRRLGGDSQATLQAPTGLRVS